MHTMAAPSSVSTIQINASDLAKYCGLNRFCSDEEVARQFWTRNLALARHLNVDFLPMARTQTEECLRRASREETRDLKTSLGLNEDADVAQVSAALRKTVVRPAAEAPKARGADTTVTQAAARHALSSSLTTAVAHDVRVERGARREREAVDAVERASGRTVCERNDRYLSSTLLVFREYSVVLVGKVDGRFADTGHVVEVKERQKRFFGHIVPYECAQLHCYMHLTHTRSALLVERFDGASQEHWVQFDDEFWRTCVTKLTQFLHARLCDAETH